MHGALSRPRRILLTTDAVGGVWHYTAALTSGLAARGWHCTIAAMGPSPTPMQRAAIAKLPNCMLIDTGLPLDWTAPGETALSHAATTLAHLVRRESADTIHLHTPCLAAYPFPVPAIAVAHSCVGTWWHAVHRTPPPLDFQWRMALMASGLARASSVIAPSAALAGAMRQIYGTTRPIDVVHNGAAPAPPAAAIRAPRILTAGRLWDPGKNIAILDAAAKHLPIEAAGPLSGPNGAQYTPSAITCLGDLPQPTLHAAMARAAIFAAPALYEPFGLAILEAAQRATPLVLADIPTFRELWNGAAIFIDPRDPHAWSIHLRALLDAPDRRAKLGAAALARAQRYTNSAMVAATATLHTEAALEPA